MFIGSRGTCLTSMSIDACVHISMLMSICICIHMSLCLRTGFHGTLPTQNVYPTVLMHKSVSSQLGVVRFFRSEIILLSLTSEFHYTELTR